MTFVTSIQVASDGAYGTRVMTVTFDSRNLSPSANVSRFSVDFIEEARELKIIGE